MTENTITDEQISAGAAVLDDDGKPVGRNTAIMVWDAMIGAAISGDAPDLQQLKALALAWTSVYGSWLSEGQIADGITDEDAVDFIRAASPAVVLGLIDRIESAAAPTTASGDELGKVHAFLLGEGKLDGAHFDEQSATRRRYWWRDHLRAAVSAATKPTREKQLEAVAHAAAMDMVRIHEALGLPADGEVDAEKIIAHIAASTPAAPAAWMRNNRMECTTAEGKKQMENAGFGRWGEIAKSYTIPLYEHAASTTGAAQTAEQVRDEFTITGNVCEMGRLDDENGEHGLVIKRETDFVTVKGLKISELQGLSRVAFDDIEVSIRAARPTPTHSSEAGDA